MDSRFGRSIIIAALILVGLYVAMPYVDRLLYSATTPRAVEPRGNLSELERSTIELFEHTSPSVVQVVGRAGAPEMTPEGGGPGPDRHRLRLGQGRAHCHERPCRRRR